MRECWQVRSLLLDNYYGDLSDEQGSRVRTHLQICTRCAKELAEVRDTLDILQLRQAEAPAPEDLARSWESIRREILAPRRPVTSNSLDLGWWVPRLAFSLLLVISGVWVGWNLRSPSGVPALPATSADLLLPLSSQPPSRLWRHLQRSEVLILEIMNFQAAADDQGALGLELSRRVSEELLEEGDLLRSELQAADEIDEPLLGLIRDLELILLQVAHLGDDPGSRDVIEAVRSAIQQQALLLRIKLAEILTKKSKPQPGKTSLDSDQSRA